MLSRKRHVRLDTDRLMLRLPRHADFRHWVALRSQSAKFLTPWEPSWASDHLTRKSFTGRVYWAQRALAQNTAVPLFIFRRVDEGLLGAITLDNIRRGPSAIGHVGLLDCEMHARQGYMREAIESVVHYSFRSLDLSRIEAACLPEKRRLARGIGKKAASNMKASRKAICRSTGAGATMCSTPICAMTGGGARMRGEPTPFPFAL